ncbi:MAG: arginine deiminase family protein [Ginsengibacter sp.]
MNITCHSDIGKIKSIFIKSAEQAFISEAQMAKYWKDLNYSGKPNLDVALSEYASFQRALQMDGAEIFHLPEDANVNMDSIYCRDASIATDKGMIICNMGKPARMNEPLAEKKAFEAHKIPILGTIIAPGTLEGGDAAWIDEHTLAVGHSYRTNEEGIRQLATMLRPLRIAVVTVPLPHYKGPEDVFHLMSILSPVDRDLAVVYSPLMPIEFRNFLLQRGYSLVEVPDEEFESMGCNVLATAPRECLMVEGNPKTKTRLEQAGCNVTVYAGNEISIKGGGGPTCLTRPIYRYK